MKFHSLTHLTLDFTLKYFCAGTPRLKEFK